MLKNCWISLPMKYKKRNKTKKLIKIHDTQEGFLKTLTDRKVVWSLRCLRFSPGGAPPPNYLPPSRRRCGCRLQRPAVDTQRKHRVRATRGHNSVEVHNTRGQRAVSGSRCVYATLGGSLCHFNVWEPINLPQSVVTRWRTTQRKGGAPEGAHVSRSGCVFVSMVLRRTGIQPTQTVFTRDTAPQTRLKNWPVCILIFFCFVVLCLLSQPADGKTLQTCVNPSCRHLIKQIMN